MGAGVGWPDIAATALLGGVGFTVSLLVGELAFGGGSARDDIVKVGVLIGSTAAALLGGWTLLLRGRVHARRR